MSNTRPLINPRRSLEKTARDLAIWLRGVDVANFDIVLAKTENDYEMLTSSPAVNYVTSFVYEKPRHGLLKKIREDLRQDNIIEKMILILNKGGWTNTSLNTNLLRQCIKGLKGYRKDIILSLDELQELGDLFKEAIPASYEDEIENREEDMLLLAMMSNEIKEDLENSRTELRNAETRLISSYQWLLDLEDDTDNKQSTENSELIKSKEQELEDLKRQVVELQQKEKENEDKLVSLSQHYLEYQMLINTLRQTLLALTPKLDNKYMANKRVVEEADKLAQHSFFNRIRDEEIKEVSISRNTG